MVITPKAIKRLAELVANSTEGNCIRIAIVGGGCSGMSYKMSFIKEYDPKNDQVFIFDHESTGNKVFIAVDRKSWLFLMDVTLDFDDGLNGQGFVWENPSAKRTCGCGSSFGV